MEICLSIAEVHFPRWAPWFCNATLFLVAALRWLLCGGRCCRELCWCDMCVLLTMTVITVMVLTFPRSYYFLLAFPVVTIGRTSNPCYLRVFALHRLLLAVVVRSPVPARLYAADISVLMEKRRCRFSAAKADYQHSCLRYWRAPPATQSAFLIRLTRCRSSRTHFPHTFLLPTPPFTSVNQPAEWTSIACRRRPPPS